MVDAEGALKVCFCSLFLYNSMDAHSNSSPSYVCFIIGVHVELYFRANLYANG